MFGKKKQSPYERLTQEVQEPSAFEQPETPAAEEQPQVPQETEQTKTEEKITMQDSDLTTSISRNTVVEGNLVSEDNMEIYGTVNGNVTTSAVLKVYGKVHGNISCNVLIASMAAIKGNILSEKSVVIHENTKVEGNITSGSITISGQVKGDLRASEELCITGTGAVCGTVDSPMLEVMKGAVMLSEGIQVKPKLEAHEVKQEPKPEPKPEVEAEPEVASEEDAEQAQAEK